MKELKHNHMNEPLNNYIEWKNSGQTKKHKGEHILYFSVCVKFWAKQKICSVGMVVSWRCEDVRAEWCRTEGLLWDTKHSRSDGYAHYFDCGEDFTGVYIFQSLCNSIC